MGLVWGMHGQKFFFLRNVEKIELNWIHISVEVLFKFKTAHVGTIKYKLGCKKLQHICKYEYASVWVINYN